MIEIDDIELLPFSSITDDDLVQTGEPDLESLHRHAAHAGPINGDTLVFARVEFHVVDQRHRQPAHLNRTCEDRILRSDDPDASGAAAAPRSRPQCGRRVAVGSIDVFLRFRTVLKSDTRPNTPTG